MTALWLALAAAPAAADIDFCGPGEGAGQCGVAEGLNSLRGLSVDFEEGLLYAADRQNNRVVVFNEAGEFVEAFGWGVDTGAAALETCGPAAPEAEPDPSLCRKGLETTALGGFQDPTELAVDNVAGSAARHDVYVVDEGSGANRRVQRFHRGASEWEAVWSKGERGEAEGELESRISLGVGPGGLVHVLDNVPTGVSLVFEHRLQRWDPETGEPIPTQCILREGERAVDLGVASDGSFWVAGLAGIRKYDEACAPVLVDGGKEVLDTDFGNANVALAVDAADRVFLAANEQRVAGGTIQGVMARDETGAPLSRFGYGRLLEANPEGLAVGAAGVFLAFGRASVGAAGIRLLEELTPPLPPPGPIVVPSSVEIEAGSVRPSAATALAEINPEGEETEVHLEFVSRADYEDQSESFAGPGTEKQTVTIEPEAGREFRLHAFEGPVGCPDPVTESSCLVPETEYLWRIVAENTDGGGEGTVEGEPFTTPFAPELLATFATEVGTDTARLGAQVETYGIPTSGYFEYVTEGAYLKDKEGGGDGFAEATAIPDVEGGQEPIDFGAGEPAIGSAAAYPLDPGAAYRYRVVATNVLIETEGKEAVGDPEHVVTFGEPALGPCANDPDRIGSGALLPDCRAYELVSPLDKEGGEIRVLKDEFQQPIVLEQAADSGDRLAYGSSRSFGGSPAAPITSQYIARRAAGEQWRSHPIDPPRGKPLVGAAGAFLTEFKAFSTDLCQGWVATLAEMPGAPAGFEPGYRNLLRRSDDLCGGGPGGSYAALAPRKAPKGIASGAEFSIDLNAVSADGGHAIFRSGGGLTADSHCATVMSELVCSNQLYESVGDAPPRLVCLLPGETPYPGPCAAGTEVSGQPRVLWNPISADGERIFFSTGGSGPRPLYVRIGGTETKAISGGADATFWGASQDGATAIYSLGNLASGAATLRRHAVDSEEDTPIAERVLGVLGMSEDATRVYFASEEALGGANSEGDEAIDGQPNLYLHREGEGTVFVARLDEDDITAAVSDDRYGKHTAQVTPSGEGALFASRAELTAYDNVEAGVNCANTVEAGNPCREIYRYDAGSEELSCLSCNPSGARPAGPSAIPSYATQTHAPRTISGDGSRAYFESADRLVARDANGRVDVYQWQAPGSGGCTEGSYDYSAQNEGCVSLISSGRGAQDARFVESRPDGRDVFFATDASLLPQDFGLFDIYDARVGGGLPVPPPPPAPCEGDACSNAAAAPEAPEAASEAYEPPAAAPASAGSSCTQTARRARRFATRAKRLRRRARRAAPRRTRALRRRARGDAVRAKRLSRQAKRCRRARSSRRAGR